MFKWVINRVKEPSTWAGLAAIILGADQATQFDAEYFNAAGIVITGLMAVVLKGRD